jgi:transcriptional regulator with XRE-family HTH domain
MRSTKKTTAIVLAGAVGISSVAYGIGTQVGGGASVAAADKQAGTSNKAGAQRDFAPPGLDDLASELGVDADTLDKALRDFHEQEHAEMRSAFASALADALGKSTNDVQAALDSLENEHKARFAAQLAKALGVDADKVTTALEQLENERPGPGRPGGPGEPGDFAADLAKKLGLKADDVEAALMDLRPPKRDGGHEREHAMPLRGLAAELDVSRAQLRTALRKMRADFRPQDHRAELVKFLADRLGISEDKVDQAMPEFPGRGPGGPQRPGGPHGPGGPRDFGPLGPGGP